MFGINPDNIKGVFGKSKDFCVVVVQSKSHQSKIAFEPKAPPLHMTWDVTLFRVKIRTITPKY